MGCESEAGKTARVYTEHYWMQEFDGAYQLVCDDDREAMSLVDWRKSESENDLTQAVIKGLLEKEGLERLQLSVLEESSGEAGSAVQVTLAIKGKKEEAFSQAVENDAAGVPCVATGWKEKVEQERLYDSVDGKIKQASDLADGYDFEAAEALLGEAEAESAALESWRKELMDGSIELQRTLIASLKATGVRKSGNWFIRADTNPMTDVEDRYAWLKAEGEDGIVNKASTIHLRCKEKKLEVYMNADLVLDSDYRYDTVRGRIRFGDAQAEKYSGGRSTDYTAVFLRNPKTWLSRFEGSDGTKIAVEFDGHSRSKTSIFMNVGSTEVVSFIRAACP